MRIGGNKVARPAIKIGEITASAAGNSNLLTSPHGVINQQYAPAALAGRERTHHARRAGANNDHVVVVQGARPVWP